MKKNFIIILFLVELYSSNTSHVHANVPVIDSTAIAKAVSNFIKDNAVQVPILAQETKTAIESTAIQINTFKTMWNQTVTRPLKDAMTLRAIAKDADQILNLVNGSTGGNSLLVADPEEYIKNKGLNVLRASYTQAEKNGGIYADSFLNNIVATARSSANTDLNTSLRSLSQSSVPSIIQENICNDKELTERAKYDVSGGYNYEYTEAELKARKVEINNTLCRGNPNTDKKLAEALITYNKESSSVGGDPWGVLLAVTSGENEYAKTVQFASRVAKEVETKQKFANQDIINGRGIKSATICVEHDENMQCTKEQIINPAGALSDAFSEAKLVSLKTAMNAFGTGGAGGEFFSEIGGILSLAGDAFNAYNQVTGAIGQITGAVDQVTGAFNDITNTANSAMSEFDKLSGRDNTNTSSADATLTARRSAPSLLANVSNVVGKSYPEDLKSYPENKAGLVLPIKNILNAHLNAVNELTNIDNNYISKINYYKSLVEGVKTCYSNVESYARNYASSTPYSNYSTPQSVLSFYSTEMQTSNNLISTLTNEINVTVPQAKSVIQDTLTKVTASNSSMEILDLSNNYSNTVDLNGLPSLSSNGVRTNEYQSYNNNVDISIMDGGSITVQNEACAAADTAVKNAIIERDRPVYYYGN